MRSGRKWWIIAQKASPFRKEVVMLVILTPLYPVVMLWLHCNRSRPLLLSVVWSVIGADSDTGAGAWTGAGWVGTGLDQCCCVEASRGELSPALALGEKKGESSQHWMTLDNFERWRFGEAFISSFLAQNSSFFVRTSNFLQVVRYKRFKKFVRRAQEKKLKNITDLKWNEDKSVPKKI